MNNKKKLPVILTLAIVAIVYYVMARLNLFVCDDFRYAFIQGTDKPVQTITDAISSQCHAYMFENGRFIVHTLVQCFAGIWGMEWLRVCNTLFFVVFIWCSCVLVNKGTGKSINSIGPQLKTVDATSLNSFNIGNLHYYIIYDSEAYPIVNIFVN